jgi:hypothetical protein
MNRLLPDGYVESIQRLALGLEPVDAGLGHAARRRLEVTLENVPQPVANWANLRPGEPLTGALPRLRRNGAWRYILHHTPEVEIPVDVRLADPDRHLVPRRCRVTIPTFDEVVAPELDPAVPPVPLSSRVLRPVLFPGAAYDVSGTATGLRGAVRRNGKPMRWARVQARLTAPGEEPVGIAHGDDRGEFLLLVRFAADHIGDPADPLEVRVTVFGPQQAPVPADPSIARADLLWDLPQEAVVLPVPADDPVVAGTQLPAGYVPGARRTVQLPLAKLSSDTPVFQFVH